MPISWCATHGVVYVAPPGPCPVGGEDTSPLMHVALALCAKCGLAFVGAKLCPVCGVTTKGGVGMTGVLELTNEVFKLNGMPLAHRAAADPLGAGTTFVREHGFNSGDIVTVIGNNDEVGDLAVFSMSSITAAPDLMATRQVMMALKAANRAPLPRGGPASPATGRTSARNKASELMKKRS
jgi:hypothetical protein